MRDLCNVQQAREQKKPLRPFSRRLGIKEIPLCMCACVRERGKSLNPRYESPDADTGEINLIRPLPLINSPFPLRGSRRRGFLVLVIIVLVEIGVGGKLDYKTRLPVC